MPRLIWSPQALRDVQRLYRFLAEKNIDAARRAVKALREGVKVIAQRPGSGATLGTLESGGFVQITADTNGDAVIWVDADGGGDNYVQVVTLEGVSAATPAALLTTLLANNIDDPTT